MRIVIQQFSHDWGRTFEKIRNELLVLLKEFNPVIEHFGSTSVPGLAAKPVIDILVGIEALNLLDPLARRMRENKRYIYYKAFNRLAPERRLFVRLKDDVKTEEFEGTYFEPEDIPHHKINHARIAHVHVWKYDSEDWVRHIAFREYLKSHDEVKLKYENLKKELSRRDWQHGMEYNEGKNEFITIEEKKAISWYLTTKTKNKN